MSTKETKTEIMTEISPNILVITVNVSELISPDCQALRHCHLCPRTLLYACHNVTFSFVVFITVMFQYLFARLLIYINY